MTALDVSANIGYTTRTLARLVHPGGMVVAIEPEPLNFQVLCANMSGFGTDHVRCVQAAASDSNGQVSLWLDESNLGDPPGWPRSR